MAGEKTDKLKTKGSKATALIKVVAKQPQGRCRAGFQFTTEPREVEVTEEQYEMIKVDPILSVLGDPVMPKAAAEA